MGLHLLRMARQHHEHNPPERQSVKPYKTHLTYVRERRSEEEAEDLLAEALAARAAARGERSLY